MTLPEHSRYVVIGAGVHGLSTAWHLAQRGGEAVSYTHLTLPTTPYV